ncbi:MAG: TonB-dependent receptor [Acidobacteria bacterium]|nr:TonB-dependent receptor [Acidobacteriota bacterium]
MMRLGLSVLLCTRALVAQSAAASGELQGTVTDPSSATVANVVVALRNSENGLLRHTLTGADGAYRFLLVPPGDYEVDFLRDAFQPTTVRGVRVTVGAVAALDVQLRIGPRRETIAVTGAPALVEAERSQQANTLPKEAISSLPIDRRDYLTFALLAPGVTDSNTIADNTDLRLKPTIQSGLSFAGSNGRGNSVTVDGGEANDFTGGVRATLPQEGVQEFQINRSNYSAELGGSSGGAINIVSRAGTNTPHGSAFDYLRNQVLDAGNPFARVLVNGSLVRTKPQSRRQQFGGSLGGAIRRNRTFYFLAGEGLIRRESSVVSLLTDTSIFSPTPAQEQVLRGLPAPAADALRAALTAPPSTVALFERNTGVFPFTTNLYRFSLRLDHRASEHNLFFFRQSVSNIEESNANLQSLVAASRGTRMTQYDPTSAGGWTHVFSPFLVNEAHAQWNYRGFYMNSLDPYGPEVRINGYGIFNRDYLLPSINIERRYEARDNLTYFSGRHTWKVGGVLLERGAHSETDVLFSGRFTFGDLPGTLLNPNLPASFTINALQAYNLGLAQTFLQGTGDPVVQSTDPSLGVFAQDSWQATRNLKLDIGLRYELDVRHYPMPTGKRDIAPRFGFAWSPGGSTSTVIRGGYGIYYAPTYYQIDWGAQALNDLGGYRQISSVFTSILTPGAAAANNIFTTLRAQGYIGVPTPSRPILPSALAQFGLSFPHTGPNPPYSILYTVANDYRDPYSQQASLGIERSLGKDMSISAAFLWSHTLRLPRTRDINLLPAPVDPTLGIRVWNSPAYFVNPLVAQRNIYESTATAIYKGLTLEIRRRFARRFGFDANYTLSKTVDDVTDFNSDFQAFDQTNQSAERARSSFDQRHRFVLYGTWDAPAGFTLSPIMRANSNHPFNLLAGYDINQDRHDTTDRPIGAGRNTGIGPNFWTVDLRLARQFRLGERAAVQATAEAFNLLNRLNLASVNNVVGNMQAPFNVTGRADRLPSQPLGFDSAYDPRRLQLGLRVSF